MSRLLVRQSARPEASHITRQLVHAMGGLSAGERNDLALLITELVNNGVRHATGPDEDSITVEVRVFERRIRVEVRDCGAGFALPTLPDRGEERANGWGLYLVDALAHRWGMDADRATVWLEVRRS